MGLTKVVRMRRGGRVTLPADYRFYRHSFKVYGLQDQTAKIVQALQGLAPQLPLNEQFVRIVAEGTGKIFKPADNRNWETVTRPQLRLSKN